MTHNQASSATSWAPKSPRNLTNYLTFSSNMSSSFLTKHRRLNQAENSSITETKTSLQHICAPCIILGYELSFHVPGMPYLEPCQAALKPVRDDSSRCRQTLEELNNLHEEHSHIQSTPYLNESVEYAHGVIHRIPTEDYERIKALEMGYDDNHDEEGSKESHHQNCRASGMYKEVELWCLVYADDRPLHQSEDSPTSTNNADTLRNRTHNNSSRSNRYVKAKTLMWTDAPSSSHDKITRNMLPSKHYMRSLIQAATEQHLDEEYIHYLESIETYNSSLNFSKELALFLTSIVLIPSLILLFAFSTVMRNLFPKQKRLFSFVDLLLSVFKGSLWMVHDRILQHVFGSGVDNSSDGCVPSVVWKAACTALGVWLGYFLLRYLISFMMWAMRF